MVLLRHKQASSTRGLQGRWLIPSRGKRFTSLDHGLTFTDGVQVVTNSPIVFQDNQPWAFAGLFRATSISTADVIMQNDGGSLRIRVEAGGSLDGTLEITVGGDQLDFTSFEFEFGKDYKFLFSGDLATVVNGEFWNLTDNPQVSITQSLPSTTTAVGDEVWHIGSNQGGTNTFHGILSEIHIAHESAPNVADHRWQFLQAPGLTIKDVIGSTDCTITVPTGSTWYPSGDTPA